jgi:hypothetical protein
MVEEEFFVVDLRNLRNLTPKRGGRVSEPRPVLREFLRELGFYTGGGTVGSKVFEKYENSSIERVWIEVYSMEGYYTLVFSLNTRDVAKVKELAPLLNNVLEVFAKKNGYKRVV